jgi:3'-phosphoadenosine 5'-phosphosulfate synthase
VQPGPIVDFLKAIAYVKEIIEKYRWFVEKWCLDPWSASQIMSWLIDEGETDHKIICIAMSDPDAYRIKNISDLDYFKPGTTDKLIDWLKRYKTSDGKPENVLARDYPTPVSEALDIIEETHTRWRTLCGRGATSSYVKGADQFWLSSPGCLGQ